MTASARSLEFASRLHRELNVDMQTPVMDPEKLMPRYYTITQDPDFFIRFRGRETGHSGDEEASYTLFNPFGASEHHR